MQRNAMQCRSICQSKSMKQSITLLKCSKHRTKQSIKHFRPGRGGCGLRSSHPRRCGACTEGCDAASVLPRCFACMVEASLAAAILTLRALGVLPFVRNLESRSFFYFSQYTIYMLYQNALPVQRMRAPTPSFFYCFLLHRRLNLSPSVFTKRTLSLRRTGCLIQATLLPRSFFTANTIQQHKRPPTHPLHNRTHPYFP